MLPRRTLKIAKVVDENLRASAFKCPGHTKEWGPTRFSPRTGNSHGNSAKFERLVKYISYREQKNRTKPLVYWRSMYRIQICLNWQAFQSLIFHRFWLRESCNPHPTKCKMPSPREPSVKPPGSVATKEPFLSHCQIVTQAKNYLTIDRKTNLSDHGCKSPSWRNFSCHLWVGKLSKIKTLCGYNPSTIGIGKGDRLHPKACYFHRFTGFDQ